MDKDIEKSYAIAQELSSQFSRMSIENINILAKILIYMRVRKGTTILKAGDVCKYIYFIDKGMLRQVYWKNGKPVTEHIGYERSMVMCIESLFKQIPSEIAIETLEPSILYAIPYEHFCSLSQSSYEFCALRIALLEESLIMSQKKADTLRFESARERYLRTLHDHPDIIRRAPLHIVASYLQMTPETLSRVRTALSEEDESKA